MATQLAPDAMWIAHKFESEQQQRDTPCLGQSLVKTVEALEYARLDWANANVHCIYPVPALGTRIWDGITVYGKLCTTVHEFV